ncbi:MAG: hypothetical protein RLZ10_1157, partial [Bacteroidota bacterium]
MKDLLVLIISYQAEDHIEQTIERLPDSICNDEKIEIVLFDDNSTDLTIEKAKKAFLAKNIKPKIFKNPKNLGYGGNQKVGYQYAINNNYAYVLMLHGDGQYPPEYIPKMLEQAKSKVLDLCYGTRLNNEYGALKGGMPLYKYVGNKILTNILNKILEVNLSEFHSGYRIYRVDALKKIRIDLNSNNFHFDTQIIIQIISIGGNIGHINIPTKYGDEISRVKGLIYAYNIIKEALISTLQKYSILYDEKYSSFSKIIDQNYASIKSSAYVKTLLKNNNKIVLITDHSKDEIKAGRGIEGIKIISSNDELVEQIRDCDAIIWPDLLSIDGVEKQIEWIRGNIDMDEKILLATVPNISFLVNRI